MTAIRGVHHINFLVKDIDNSRQYFSTLLGCEPAIEQLDKREVLTARYPLGAIWLVLVQPLNASSEIGKLLIKKGEGLFLLSLDVDSIKAAEQQFSETGIALADKGLRQGADNWQVWDLQPPVELGSILQICQSR